MATPAKRVFRPPRRLTSRPDSSTSRPIYRPRQPTATPLYPVVQHHLETFLAQAAESDPLRNGIPVWVERDFRAYLGCGILTHGFARARCDDCGHERLIAFSRKGRGSRRARREDPSRNAVKRRPCGWATVPADDSPICGAVNRRRAPGPHGPATIHDTMSRRTPPRTAPGPSAGD